MDDFAAINSVYEQMIPSPKPARTCIQAGKREYIFVNLSSMFSNTDYFVFIQQSLLM